MALGSTVYFATPGLTVHPIAPVSITSNWQTIIDANGPATQDAATITNPTTQIVNSTTHAFHRQKNGTLLCLRLMYDDGLSDITNPIVKVFGRSGTDDWQLLQSKAGSLTATLTTASTDSENGTNKFTTVDQNNHVWDCMGCDQILVGVQTALAGTGTVNTSTIQAKLI